ncbi:hypothetical protein CHGG_02293 [Chaetomium globosum CBS 148.51]|uniref:Glycosyltransferase family 31 protein n=1 Tax=Chaetomium globosum (strain ATCC 6205 / CBS 148.51 / DSM 1962 / NBRC 6347 / NRRL 1970) TaxID=306901 RepID=Q2HBW1_CHAGB|nr:uncharacterized protein CHGG_02293 [Chaetomium globosum CBS 148.51]EAQ90358.1 hypothetical protein CHGG_02293 [Chaetomium globosum CBS 148.51]
MGATIPRHRFFSMRNTLVRALILAVAMFAIGGIFLPPDVDVRAAILKTAASAREAMTVQTPMGRPESAGWGPDGELGEQDVVVGGDEVQPTISNSSHVMTCGYDMERLKRWQELYGLEEVFEYTKRYVQASREDIPRKSVTRLDQDFLADASQGGGCEQARFVDPRTSSINEWTYWLTDGKGKSNGGKLVLLLLDASDDQLEDAYSRLANVGIDVDVYRSDPNLIMAVRYLALAPRLYNHPERVNKKWLVICDDDTFFPSFNGLSNSLAPSDQQKPQGPLVLLGKNVNNNQQTWVASHWGAPACSFSVPHGCHHRRQCIYDNSEVRLTLLNDLWQLDFLGDPSGFYESGIKPLSLHHYRGGIWHVAYPWHYTKVAHACGEDCTMQRFQTADDFVISNGYSIAYYPRGIDFDLNQIEATFRPAPDDKGWNLDFMMGPQRPPLRKSGRKIAWELLEANVNEDGSVSQVYVAKRKDGRWTNGDGSPMNNRDGIIELVWLPE